MSLGYADKLKHKKNLGGTLGSPEYTDSVEDVQRKMKDVAVLLSKDGAKAVAFTGAGISTATGIPDFRGPTGIWTLRSKKQPLPPMNTRFEYAKPSFTHMALAALLRAGKLMHVCSQNVDSLHLRSGLPRDLLAELHGNCFAERCERCRREYFRDFEIETVGFKATGRTCIHPGCGGALIDNTLDWDSKLPDDELQEAVDQADAASMALVLGTSLQIAPANELPLVTREAGGKIVIVNLQKTPRDRQAHLIIRARVDFCMALLVKELGLAVPQYTRRDAVVLSHRVTMLMQHSGSASGGAEEGKEDEKQRVKPDELQQACGWPGWGFVLRVHSRHGEACAMPMVRGVRLWLPDSQEAVHAAKAGLVEQRQQQQRQQQQRQQQHRQQQHRQQQQDGQAGSNDSAADPTSSSCEQAGASRSGAIAPSGHGAGLGSSGSAGSAGGVGHEWGPCMEAAGPPPFCLDLTHAGLPGSVSSVRCKVELVLCDWADADRRSVVLEHVVERGMGGKASGEGGLRGWEARGRVVLEGKQLEADAEGEGATQNGGSKADPGKAKAETAPKLEEGWKQEDSLKAEDKGEVEEDAAGEGCVGSGPGWAVHRFVTQVAAHDPEAVIAAYLANPPEVKQPEPRKKQKTDGAQGQGEGAAAKALPPAPTRKSERSHSKKQPR